jgi:hypothetical protein
MSFLEKYKEYSKLVLEQGEEPVDATTPDQTAQPAAVETPGGETQVNVPPEGYVNIVRLLAKALSMNIPVGELDSIYSGQEITKENAFEMQNALKTVMKDNEVNNDNIERLNNPNYKKFAESINANNFMQKLNSIVAAMKKKDPYINEL